MGKRTVLVVAATSTAALSLTLGTVVVVSVARLNLNGVVFGGVLSLFVVGCVSGGAAWVLGMMQAARLSRWDWFVEVLALGPLGALIFGLAGPSAEVLLPPAVRRAGGNAPTCG
jgi:hypothetical protein